MSAETMAPIREVLAFEHEKPSHPSEYRDMTLRWEIGVRAFDALDGSCTPRRPGGGLT